MHSSRWAIRCLILFGFLVSIAFTQRWEVPAPIQFKTVAKNYYRDDSQPTNTEFSVADSISYFSVDLIKELHRGSKSGENVLCSPINVYSALAILLLGASGSTWNEIKGAMRLPSANQLRSSDSIHRNISDLLRQIQDKNIKIGNKTVSQVTLANGIFIDNHQRIKSAYETAVLRYYNGHLKKLNFSDGYTAINQINNWIATKTSGQISKIFSEPLDQQSSIVEVASVYFSGGWSERFPAHLTRTEIFEAESRSISVEMMNNKNRIPYLDNTILKFQSIHLDFHGRHFSAIFVLPYEDNSISKLMESFNRYELVQILGQTNTRGVNYKIPRMKISSSKSLKESLQSKGLQKVFEKADFSPMLDSSGQKISDISHAVDIEVDELGAKATAMTSVRIEPLAAKNPPENTVEFYLNRPFLMLILHRATSTVLFSAVVHEPVQ